MKINFLMKLLLIVTFFILSCCILLFGVLKKLTFTDEDFCLDTGCCVAGMKVNTEYGLIEINEQNCLKYGWDWDTKFNRCQLYKGKYTQ